MVCFVLSAVMELFIKIPFVKWESGIGIWHIIKQDFSESIKFIREERPVIRKELVVICGTIPGRANSRTIPIGNTHTAQIIIKFPEDFISSFLAKIPAKTPPVVIAVCCFIIMVFSTIFTIQMMSFVQAETPQNLVGKVISVICAWQAQHQNLIPQLPYMEGQQQS